MLVYIRNSLIPNYVVGTIAPLSLVKSVCNAILIYQRAKVHSALQNLVYCGAVYAFPGPPVWTY